MLRTLRRILVLVGLACGLGACSDAADSAGSGGATGATSSSTGGAAAGTGGSGSGVGGAVGTGGAGGEGGGVPEPDFDTIPWSTGDTIGHGVAFKDTGNPRGENAFIGYAGYGIPLGAAEAWVRELYAADLKARGVRWVYAVQGPADVYYSGFEIGNSKIAAALGAELGPTTDFVLVAAHSSGTYVAHELLGQLESGLDPMGVTDGRVVYFDLDGGSGGLYPAAVARLRKAYFVAAVDPTVGTYSPNQPTMASAGATYASKGGYFELDVSGSGCNAGGVWCMHMTVITEHPHDPNVATGVADYSDYAASAVVTRYITQKASEAGL
jgi:hypothetical protein